MRIDSGNIGMDSARLYRSSQRVRSSVETSVSTGNTTGSQLTPSLFSNFFLQNGLKEDEKSNGKSPENAANEDFSEAMKTDEPILEDEAIQNAFGTLSAKNRIYVPAKRSDAAETFQKLHQEFIQNLIKLIFKQRPKCNEAAANADAPGLEAIDEGHYELVSTTETFESFTEETETTFFQASGLVKTDDGREIDVNINLKMSSRFVSYYSESITAFSYNLTDPLVINLSDAPASLSDVTYFFDLDCDGEEEEISKLSSDSGYLALDKNGDGKINDGSELFGTTSGDGFKDLAAYDEDRNGWIDENDSIFEKLKIWTKDENGNDILYTLKDKNVGAINLGSADTDFTLNSVLEHNVTGVIRRTGIFLYETGEVGTVQHLDLAT